MIPKFRAWDEENKRFLDEEEFIIISDGRVLVGDWMTGNDFSYGYDDPERFILMQSTGLFDKNGKEIFEGDIVKRTYLFNGAYGETHTGEVVYDKEYARYVISKPNKFIEPQIEDLRNVLSGKSTYEIIGSIYENKELLEAMK